MQAFSEGRYNLGRPGSVYADKNIVDTLYTSDSLRLDVGTFQIDTAKQTIYDLKPQRTLPLRAEEITGYLFGGLFLLLNLAALALRAALSPVQARQTPERPLQTRRRPHRPTSRRSARSKGFTTRNCGRTTNTRPTIRG